MILDNLDKKLKSLKQKFESDLKAFIVLKGHKGNGKLIKSVNVDVKNTNGKYTIEIDAAKYIQYLDHGDFLKKFLSDKQKELEKIIQEEVEKDIVNIFKQLK